MKKTIIILVLMFLVRTSWSQELKLNIGYGFATTESSSFKYNAVLNNKAIGVDFTLRKNIAFSTGLIHNTITGNSIKSNNIAIFRNDYFLLLPVTIKFYTPIVKDLKAFAEIGGYSAYHYLNRNEVFQNNTKSIIKTRNLGFTFGAHVNFGIKNKINSAWSYELFVNGQEDLFFSYNTSNNKVENDRFSLNLALYRKLKK